jgi:hypothetical protein
LDHEAELQQASDATASIFWMGGEFLPPFNEGTLTIEASMPVDLVPGPGANVEASAVVSIITRWKSTGRTVNG